MNNTNYVWPKNGADGKNVYVAFRLIVDMAPQEIAGSLVVNVSAASFYRLWVNGSPVGRGPVREWKGHIGIDPWDLKPFLHPGRNVISVLVHCYGVADVGTLQLTRGGFSLQGNVGRRDLSTGSAPWQCRILPGWNAESPRISVYNGFCEDIDMASYEPCIWEHGADVKGWKKPVRVLNPQKHWPHSEPRSIPPLREQRRPLRLVASGTVGWAKFGSWAQRIAAMKVESAANRVRTLGDPFPIRILPGKPVHLRLDVGDMTSGGAALRLHAAGGETLYIAYADRIAANGNADATHGGDINNNVDRLVLRPGSNRWESMINLRGFRYLDLSIFNLHRPLLIEDAYAREIAYPTEPRARFRCSDPVWNRIWDASVRTAALCMADTFMDNPSRERQQYGGDGRAQAWYAWSYFGDERLTRQFLRQYGQGIRADGAIQSGGPWCWNQIIPAWQLHWIEAVREYIERSGDESILAEIANPVWNTLEWMHGLLVEDGLLAVPEKFNYTWPEPDVLWNFIDWQGTDGPAGQVHGEPARISLNCLYFQALGSASALMRKSGHAAWAKMLNGRQHAIGRTLRKRFAVDEGLETEHALIFATLAGLIGGKLSPIAEKMKAGRFTTDFVAMPFLLEALAQDGHAVHALAGIRNVCKRMLDEGASTCFEIRETMKSKSGRALCQGISAFAGYYMLRLLAGIQVESPLRRRVSMRPCGFNMDWLTAALPTPDGEVSVTIEKTNKGPRIQAAVPPGWHRYRGENRCAGR